MLTAEAVVRSWRAARVLMGLTLVINAPVGTLILRPGATTGPGPALMAALWGSPFIMVLVKLVELPLGLFLLASTLLLAWEHRDAYRPLLRARPSGQ
ncbi:hypothetical protein JQX13_24135 [Archangium violaceum]|uniref:hypothetical protein n=1 Tax=Archangium violaceum TaxID=83451 RepID=UPI00193B59D8|nr:hypothetical protein [Archangium violaceum]QRK12849.1 hypothetical protein JQX13_24135 [Archangium violaceum]